jgi:Right handed beta helix region
MKSHYIILALVGVLLGVLPAALWPGRRAWLPQVAGGPRTFYISPAGDDANSGARPDAPLATIQLALDRAGPGDRVTLAPGGYSQDISTRRDGTAAAPITISGPRDAVLRGAGRSRVITINHDHITLEGFTVDGLWGRPDRSEGYRNKLLYAVGTAPGDGVVGLRVLYMAFANAGGECLRLRYFAQHNEVAHSSFTGCGVYDFKFRGGGKNGEAIYIGTARAQLGDGRNPTDDLDQSSYNWIHHNRFDTGGNECVDIKEGSAENIVEHNSCTGQRDPHSAGLDARGNRNVLRSNHIYGNVGAGVRLGGKDIVDGVDNEVSHNTIIDNRGGGLKILRPQQGLLCGNELRDNDAGAVVGHATVPDPALPCPGGGALEVEDRAPGAAHQI